MPIAVVINSAAGGLLGRTDAAADVAARLAAAGLDVVIEPEDGRGIVERIAAAAAAGAEAVVVGGGDGTIACAAQHLAGTDTALGILPLGTMNMLAKDLAIPLDLDAAAAALADGVVREIDIGEVNGHVFACASVLGMPSRLARQRERSRGAMSMAAYWRFAVAGLRQLNRYPPLKVALDVGQGPKRIRTRAIAIVDNEYDEGLGQVFTRSRLDRGDLVVYVARGLTLWRVLMLGLGMVLGRWRGVAGLDHYAVKRLVIHSRRKRLRVMNDGEVLMLRPPLRYRMRPKALKVIVPRAAAGKAEPDEVPEPLAGSP